jgi:hypothetical protein
MKEQKTWLSFLSAAKLAHGAAVVIQEVPGSSLSQDTWQLFCCFPQSLEGRLWDSTSISPCLLCSNPILHFSSVILPFNTTV